MTDIIFAYTPMETNWLNPEWRKFKMVEIFERDRKNAMIILEERFPNVTIKALSVKLGISYGYYSHLRTKYNLKKRR